MIDRDKILRSLENLEVSTYDTEKEAITEVENCKPSKLFNLIAQASSYRMMAGCAEEEYPDDADVKEHVKSAKNLLIHRALNLTSKYEKDCLCINKDRIGIELRKVLSKYKYI